MLVAVWSGRRKESVLELTSPSIYKSWPHRFYYLFVRLTVCSLLQSHRHLSIRPAVVQHAIELQGVAEEILENAFPSFCKFHFLCRLRQSIWNTPMGMAGIICTWEKDFFHFQGGGIKRDKCTSSLVLFNNEMGAKCKRKQQCSANVSANWRAFVAAALVCGSNLFLFHALYVLVYASTTLCRVGMGKMRAGTILRVLAKLHVVGVSSTHSDNGKASSHGNVMDDGGYERKRRIPPLLQMNCAVAKLHSTYAVLRSTYS